MSLCNILSLLYVLFNMLCFSFNASIDSSSNVFNDSIHYINAASYSNHTNNSIINYCKNSSDCLDDYYCDNNYSQCIHNGFLPFKPKSFISILFVCFISAIATTAGIGGGTLIQTILMSIENFTPNEATPISISIVLCCSIATFFMGAKAKLEYNDYNFVDYDIMLVCFPLILFGSKIGTILNMLLPVVILILLLLIVISYGSITLYRSANYLRNKELEDERNINLNISNQITININRSYSKRNSKIKENETIKDIIIESYSNNNKMNNRNKSTEDIEMSYINSNKNLKAQNIQNNNLSEILLSDIEKINKYQNNENTANINNISKTVKDNGDIFNLLSILNLKKSKINKRKNSTTQELIKNSISNDNNLSQISQNKDDNEYNDDNDDDEKNIITDLKLEENNIKEEEKALIELTKKIKEMNIIKSKLLSENTPFNLNRLKTFFEMLIILILIELCLGNKNIKSMFNIIPCSIEYYLIILIFGSTCVLISYMSINVIRKEEEISNLFSDLLLPQDDNLINSDNSYNNKPNFLISTSSSYNLNKLRLYSFLTGVISSTCGVGGGIIIAPILIDLGVNPKSAASTSILLVIMSSLVSTVLFLLLNRFYFSYSVVFCLLSTISALVGNYYVNDYITRTKRMSFLIYVLFYLMIASLIFIPLNGLLKATNEYNNNGSIFIFGNIC